jgi:Na+-transporting methylmalonyl-CoA/oxaloacetate decarboxylase gamma subunit
MNPDSLSSEPAVEQAESQPMPMQMPAVQPIGLSAVLDVKNKEGKVIGHYQWAFHKDGKADSLVVVKVAKDHEGNEQILYQTYSESAIAKKVAEEAAGAAGVKENMATVKIGEAYRVHDGTVSNYGIGDLLTFQSFGFVLVLAVLAGLWGMVSFVSYIVKTLGLAEQPKSIQPKPTASAAKTIHPGMSDEQFVAIVSAAAAHALGGKPVSVVKFRPLNTMDWTWAIQGRVSLHTRKV